MNLPRIGLVAAFVALAAGAGTPQSVLAQDAGARVLEEITVTARKREESLIEVPVAISAFTAEALEAQGIDELPDILDKTVGMVFNDRDGTRVNSQPGVRGIKSFTGGGSSVRVSSFVDGMPMVGFQSSIPFVDVASVEVYRGPQSAVFGRSVFAGAINYSLREPSLDGQSGGVNLQLGQDGRQAFNGYYTRSIIDDKLGVYVSASKDSYDGPQGLVSSDGYDMGNRETEYFSVGLKFQPTDQLSMTLRYTDTTLDDGPAPDYNLTPYDPINTPNEPQNYTQTPAQAAGGRAPLLVGELQFDDDPELRRNFCRNLGLANQNCALNPGFELDRERLSFDANYGLENGASLSFKAFSSEDVQFATDDQDNSDLGNVSMANDTNIDEDYFEVLWTSPDDARLRYSLGYSSYEYTLESVGYNSAHPSSTLTGADVGGALTTNEIKNTGFFGGLFYDITDNITVSFEGRQQEDEILANDPDPTDNLVPEAVSDTFLPRLSLNYTYSDTLSFYAQYSRGVQPATVNTGAVGPSQRAIADALIVLYNQDFNPLLDNLIAVDEEVLDNREIGLKGVFLDGRLSLNVALFDIETDGYVEETNVFFFPVGTPPPVAVGALNAYGAQTNNPLLQGLAPGNVRLRGGVNVGDMSSRGLEVDGSYLLSDNWTFDAQFTYLKTKFDSVCSPSGPTYGIAATTLPIGTGTLACSTADGNAFPFTPEIQLGASATYNSVLSNGWGWFTRLDMRFEDEQYIDSFETGWLPSSTKFNLRAGINTDNIRIEAYVENLTDDRTPLGAQYEPARPEVTQATGIVGPNANGINVAAAYPREVGIKFSYNF